MATSGRLLCLCLVWGLVFEFLGNPIMEEKRSAKTSTGDKYFLNDDCLETKCESDALFCQAQNCTHGCCENGTCNLGCDVYEHGYDDNSGC